VELLPGARKPIGSRTRLRVHLGTAEVLARVVQIRSIGPGEHGLARLVLETPLVARGGDRFVVRSFSPVTTIGGGVVLDPFPAPRPRLRQRRLAAEQLPIERLLVLAQEAGLAGLSTDSLPTRLGLLPGQVPTLITEAGKDLLSLGATVVARHALAAEATRLVEVLRRYHKEHPIDPGMSLQALRAAVPAPAAPQALESFRSGLEAALAELGKATPAELRERFGLTRKYLIPLLEWADRRGITRRAGDARVLARLTAGKGGP